MVGRWKMETTTQDGTRSGADGQYVMAKNQPRQATATHHGNPMTTRTPPEIDPFHVPLAEFIDTAAKTWLHGVPKRTIRITPGRTRMNAKQLRAFHRRQKVSVRRR